MSWAHVRSPDELHAQVLQQVATLRAQASATVAVDLQRTLAAQAVPLIEMCTIHSATRLMLVAANGGAVTVRWWPTSLTGRLPKGLDAQDRAKRIHDIGKEVALVEAAEDALLREADELGHPLDSRPQLRPHVAVPLDIGE